MLVDIMKRLIIIIAIIAVYNSIRGQGVQIVNDWYYLDGQKFFVKGIGYETHTRPGQVPWVYSFDADVINFDLQRIKSAGYNTIRTWGAISEEELQLIESSGLKILFGIWIDPEGDFGDLSFQIASVNQVDKVLSYSKDFGCIIGYIIMNEPQVQHIYDAGASGLSDLWNLIKNRIHELHPGIPVSFSNTMIGDYIDMAQFDFAAYNAYIYNPVTITASHGYAGYLSFLKKNRAPDMPMIITEFGLSVSPGISNPDYGYGGNTLEQQITGDLLMYRELIDAGTQGGFVFQYHDGWWKGGDEFVHDPVAEEYFGLVEFSGLSDKYGAQRPVWNAFSEYNRAIITSPRNGEIYNKKIPVEIFLTDDVDSYNVTFHDSVLWSDSFTKTWYTDTINYTSASELMDLDLNFHFFDSNGDTLKSEQIIVLYSKNELQLPELKLEVIPSILTPGGQNYLKMTITNNPIFKIRNNEIYYVSHPHIGFIEGDSKSKTMVFSNNIWSYLDDFYIPVNSKVATFGAGFTIEYGKFSKVISAEKILMHGDWADPIAAPELVTGIQTESDKSNLVNARFELYQNYPNPFNPRTIISWQLAVGRYVQLSIFNILGEEVTTLISKEMNPGSYSIQFDGSDLVSGVYYYQLVTGQNRQVKKMILLR
jgi:hypothetical protein